MKKFISAVVLSVASTVSMASSPGDDVCPTMSRFAKEIMKQRQSGRDMSELMTIMSPKSKADEKASEVARHMVVLAYSEPAYNSPEYQQRAISDFANTMSLECYKRSGS